VVKWVTDFRQALPRVGKGDGIITAATEKSPPGVESIEELRRLVQEPVEHRNDLTGRLYGSRISIFVTRFFLARGWHADLASFLMLFNGLAGSVLLVFPGWPQVFGFFLLESYYLFDCVDGELARYHRISHVKAAYYDYIAHILVKSAMFLCLGIGLAREPAVASPWPVFVAIAPMLAVVFTKIAADLHHVIFGTKFLQHRDEVAVANFLGRPREAGPDAGGGRRGSVLGTIRQLVLNFDLYLILFLVAAFLDVAVGAPAGIPAWLGYKMALFLFYAAALPLNFLDHVVSDLRTTRILDRIDVLQRNLDERIDEGDSKR
jgi:phosphatidylglycerophosphate synthase